MSDRANLSVRHQKILKAVIEHYITTAEPVASQALVRQYGFDVSSATIRNVMGRLEEAGLLYQPHVSAGRVPSDSGYRTYVDRLIVPDEKIDRAIRQILQQELQIVGASFTALLQRAAKILSTLSGYIALITFPQNLNSTLRHLQLVRVAGDRVMLIIVTDSGQTQSILMESPLSEDEVDESSIDRELQLLSNFIDGELKGLSLAEVTALDWANVDREFSQYTDFLDGLLDSLKSVQAKSSPMVIQGVAELLRQPEFSQLQQVQTLLSLLEQQDRLSPIIFTLSEIEDLKRVKIKIGEENQLEPMQTCALISANYYQDDTPVGSVGILGPKRMLYENAIALVENTADYLSNPFQALA